VVFYCYFKVCYSSESNKFKLVVLEDVVHIDNTGCSSGTRSQKGWESRSNIFAFN